LQTLTDKRFVNMYNIERCRRRQWLWCISWQFNALYFMLKKLLL